MAKRRQVLRDHKRVGKRFISPFQTALGTSLEEISWVVDLVPEVVWLALFNETYGMAKGAELALTLPRAVLADVQDRSGFWGLTSTFAPLSDADWIRIRNKVHPQALEDVRKALRPLASMFPDCPFTPLWSEIPQEQPSDLEHV